MNLEIETFSNKIMMEKNVCQSSSRQPHSTTDHLNNRQYWRDLVLGVNDGLVSTFLLVAGVLGGGMDNKGILLVRIQSYRKSIRSLKI